MLNTMNGRDIWSIPAAALADASQDDTALGAKISRYAEKGPSDGYIIDGEGRVFSGDVTRNAVTVFTPGSFEVFAQDDTLLRWADGFAFVPDSPMYIVANQLNTHPALNMGTDGRTNAEYHLVDARITGHAPKSIDTAGAAALPLLALTAQEIIFDRLNVTNPVPGAANAIVIIAGAGGVGSIAIQLLRGQTDLTIIATASRPKTADWVKELGAHHVVDHSKPLAEQIAAFNIGAPVFFVFSTNYSETYVKQIAEFSAPQGRFGLIDDPKDFDIMPFKGGVAANRQGRVWAVQGDQHHGRKLVIRGIYSKMVHVGKRGRFEYRRYDSL